MVTQYLIEEACFELAAVLESRAGSSSVTAGEAEPETPAERHARMMAELKAS